MQTSLKVGCMFALVIGGAIVTPEPSSALPIGAVTADSTSIEHTDWACGPGRHINPWGSCVPNYWSGYGYGYSGGGGGWNGSGWQRTWQGGYPGWQGGGYYGYQRGYRHRDDDDD